MKFSEAKDAYYTHSGNLSGITRQLAFAGIAIVWIFNESQSSHEIKIPALLLWGLLFLGLTLIADIFQYISSSIAWHRFIKKTEEEFAGLVDDEQEVVPDSNINNCAEKLFYSKIILIVISYLILIIFLLIKIF